MTLKMTVKIKNLHFYVANKELKLSLELEEGIMGL